MRSINALCLIVIFITPLPAQGSRSQGKQNFRPPTGCLRPQNGNDIMNCVPENVSNFPAEYTSCDCVQCPQLKLNLKCNLSRKTWEPYDESYRACKLCTTPQNVPKQCRADSVPPELKCEEGLIGNPGDQKECSCRSSCKDVFLTCGDNGNWIYDTQICKIPAEYEEQPFYNGESKVILSYYKGRYNFKCDPGWDLQGSTWANCRDGVLDYEKDFQNQPECIKQSDPEPSFTIAPPTSNPLEYTETTDSNIMEPHEFKPQTLPSNQKPKNNNNDKLGTLEIALIILLVICAIIILTLITILCRQNHGKYETDEKQDIVPTEETKGQTNGGFTQTTTEFMTVNESYVPSDNIKSAKK